MSARAVAIAGRGRFRDRGADGGGARQWGEGEELAAAAGIEYQHAANCGWVARAFAFSAREENLTFYHHRVAMAAPVERRQECVNPAHLFLGTDGDNQRDKTMKNRAGMKLTPALVARIRAEKRKLKHLVADYGVNISSVSAVRSRRSWKHVP